MMVQLMNRMQGVLLFVALLTQVGWAVETPDGAPAERPDAAPSATDTNHDNARRLWAMHWRGLAEHYVEHDGAFACFPDYAPGRLNSSGMTPAEYKKSDTFTLHMTDESGKETVEIVTKPQEEIDAATRSIPDFEVGQYGFIWRGVVEQVIDKRTVQLRNIDLIDAPAMRRDYEADLATLHRKVVGDVETVLRSHRDGRFRRDRVGPIAEFGYATKEAIDWRYEQRRKLAERQHELFNFRLTVHGVDTAKARQGERFPAGDQGLHIAIVQRQSRSAQAVPGSRVGKPVTEEQFTQVVTLAGYDQTTFGELLIRLKRDHGKDFEAHALEALRTGGRSDAGE